MSDKGSEAVNMDSEFNFNKIAFLDVGGIFREGRVIATDLVD